MENKSHALLAGIFVLLLLLAAAVTAIWLGRKNVTYSPFQIVSNLPVGGLSIQSQVRYQGMAVGQVQGLSIETDKPGLIRIQIGVLPSTPITKGTWAEISTQGVTGISNIDLRDDGANLKRVTSSAQNPYSIPVRPGFFQKLQKSGVEMLEDGEIVLDRLERFVTAKNAQTFGEILQNTNTLTTNLNQSLATLAPTLDALPKLVNQLEGTLANVNKMGDEVSALMLSAKQTIDLLNNPSGPLQQATASLKQLQRSAAQLQASTLPQIDQMIEAISQASRSFSRTADQLEQVPQSLLFGAPPVRPGPGEPGFGGFKESDQP
jgi:phospholipid/cholesterol/gamma-HCH transport system substrate-binding protein